MMMTNSAAALLFRVLLLAPLLLLVPVSLLTSVIASADTSSVTPTITLNVTLDVTKTKFMPPVMIVYWPEDSSLNQFAVMDHKAGHFTEKLIVGKQGSDMLLRNNDDVGHTIYVKDIKQNVKWQLNYMPPHSEFKQSLYWDEDIFVEMRCRLHHYMSAWVGSITSNYYKIVEPEEKSTHLAFKMEGIPAHLSKIKIWMPKYPLQQTSLTQGAQTLALQKSGKTRGTILLSRE